MRRLPGIGRKQLHHRHDQPRRRRVLALTRGGPPPRPEAVATAGRFARPPARVPLRPTRFDVLLAGAAGLLLLAVLTAILRGRSQWHQASAAIWLHLATIVVALALTPVMLLRRRGDRIHRLLGYLWVVSLTATAAISFAIRTINPGGFSLIHVLSAVTLIQTPLAAWYARTGRLVAHVITVRLLVATALVVAGFFTFPFGRMLGRWLG